MPWPVELVLIAVGLAMDAFAVSVTNGILIPDVHLRHALKTGLFFGTFQAAMPLIGYLLGQSVSVYISAYDHWVAFAMLSFIGGRMILEAVKARGGEETADKAPARDPMRLGVLIGLAFATSIDALAVGISLALLAVPIISACLTIGVVAFALSATGVMLGRRIGSVFRRYAEIAGGSVLVAIGLKILTEHLLAHS